MELNFNYCDKKEWSSYIERFIFPIRDKADTLLRFWNYLSDNYSGLSFSELQKNINIIDKLLGGIDTNGNYRNRSIALFYKKFFGWSLNNIDSYLLHQTEGIEREIYTEIIETDFITFIKNLIESCEKILISAQENQLIETSYRETSDLKLEELMFSDEAIMENIIDLYRHILEYTIYYNEKTLFIWTLRKNTKRYITFQYKDLSKNDNFETLKEILGLFVYYSIELPGETNSKLAEKIKNEYTVWQLKKQFGYNVCQLNKFIFESFSNSNLLETYEFLIPNVENLKEKYSEYLDRKKPFWAIPEFIKIFEKDTPGNYPSWHYRYKIDGIILTELFRTPSWKNYSSETKKYGESLLDYLDGITPALFVGGIDPERLKIENEWIWIEKEYY